MSQIHPASIAVAGRGFVYEGKTLRSHAEVARLLTSKGWLVTESKGWLATQSNTNPGTIAVPDGITATNRHKLAVQYGAHVIILPLSEALATTTHVASPSPRAAAHGRSRRSKSRTRSRSPASRKGKGKGKSKSKGTSRSPPPPSPAQRRQSKTRSSTRARSQVPDAMLAPEVSAAAAADVGSSAAVTPSASEIDHAWVGYMDASKGRMYFHNTLSDKTIWKMPDSFVYGYNAAVSVWRSITDPSTGNRYYYNENTKETTWTKPVELQTEKERQEIQEFASMQDELVPPPRLTGEVKYYLCVVFSDTESKGLDQRINIALDKNLKFLENEDPSRRTQRFRADLSVPIQLRSSKSKQKLSMQAPSSSAAAAAAKKFNGVLRSFELYNVDADGNPNYILASANVNEGGASVFTRFKKAVQRSATTSVVVDASTSSVTPTRNKSQSVESSFVYALPLQKGRDLVEWVQSDWPATHSWEQMREGGIPLTLALDSFEFGQKTYMIRIAAMVMEKDGRISEMRPADCDFTQTDVSASQIEISKLRCERTPTCIMLHSL